MRFRIRLPAESEPPLDVSILVIGLVYDDADLSAVYVDEGGNIDKIPTALIGGDPYVAPFAYDVIAAEC